MASLYVRAGNELIHLKDWKANSSRDHSGAEHLPVLKPVEDVCRLSSFQILETKPRV